MRRNNPFGTGIQYVILHMSHFKNPFTIEEFQVMIEQRGAERYKKEVPVTYSDGKENYKGLSADFSVTGIFIITREPFKPGSPIKITLEISNKKRIYLSGTVIRTIKTGELSIKDGMGIKLNETPFVYHNFIEKLKSF